MENLRTALKVLSILFFFLLCSWGKQENPPTFNLESDFETLMGKGGERWQFIQTKEDFQNLDFFKKIYLAHLPLLKQQAGERHIPKVIHFIWIGPKPFPRESVENVRSWIAHHPDWKVKFWTDRDRPLPHPDMICERIQDFHFDKLEKLYLSSDNYGEKSDLLRLEILFKEGGVYVDHDVKCLKNFDELGALDLYCGMELPYKTCLSTSVLPTNNLIGSKRGHPILQSTMDWLLAHWDELERDYPGKDRDSLINRVAHRTFYSFGYSFKQCANQAGNQDIALPAYFFNAPDDRSALFARHQYAGEWFENESAFEKMARKRLMMLSKKTNLLLLIVGMLGGLNLLALLFWLIWVLNKKFFAQQVAQRK